jgi:hypothetical protein
MRKKKVSRKVRVTVTNNVGFDARVMDQIIVGIREAIERYDVIISGKKKPKK